MRTEITLRVIKKSRLDRIEHYNVCMVLKVKEDDRLSYVNEARKAYRWCRNKDIESAYTGNLREER